MSRIVADQLSPRGMGTTADKAAAGNDPRITGAVQQSSLGAEVRSTPLTGLSTADSSTVTAENTVLQGLGKLQAQSQNKVDKVAGKQLSTEDYTTAEKSKLAGLESSKWKGLFVSLTALQAGVPSPSAGDYGDVDLGAGEPVTRYLWDVSDSEWIPQAGESAPVTSAQVKSLYEANANTNAFTDAEKSKLSGIATGATANVGTVTSVGLSAPTGLTVSGSPVTTSGTLTISYTAGYAIPTTAKQGQWDTAYSWGNHASAGYASASRTISAGTGLTGGGDLTANRSFAVSYGTAAGTATQGNDSRVNNGQTAYSWGNHASAGYVPSARTVSAGTGLTGGGDLTANRTLSVSYGTTSGTSAQGNDSRINNGQTAYGWGNHASAGYVPSARTVSAGTGLTGGGDLTTNRSFAVSYGTAAGTAAQGNDSRINNGQTAYGWGNHASAGYAPTASPTFTGTVTMPGTTGQDNALTRFMLKDTGYEYYDATSATTLNYVNGSVQRWTPTGSVALTITNWPPSGNLGELIVEGIDLGAATIDWGSINWVLADGSTSQIFADTEVTLLTSGTDWVILWTRDSGTTVYGKVMR